MASKMVMITVILLVGLSVLLLPPLIGWLVKRYRVRRQRKPDPFPLLPVQTPSHLQPLQFPPPHLPTQFPPPQPIDQREFEFLVRQQSKHPIDPLDKSFGAAPVRRNQPAPQPRVKAPGEIGGRQYQEGPAARSGRHVEQPRRARTTGKYRQEQVMRHDPRTGGAWAR